MATPISIWFQRKDTGDFRVTIRATEHGFDVRVNDMYGKDWYENYFQVETYDEVVRYLDTVCNQVLNDRDAEHPFTYVQYTVPNFPSVIAEVKKLRDDGFYQGFCEAMEFHYL